MLGTEKSTTEMFREVTTRIGGARSFVTSRSMTTGTQDYAPSNLITQIYAGVICPVHDLFPCVSIVRKPLDHATLEVRNQRWIN